MKKKRKSKLSGKVGDPDRFVGYIDYTFIGRREDGTIDRGKKKLKMYCTKGPMPGTPEHEALLKKYEARRQAEKRKPKAG
ncbi:MAG: hypothetical protein IT462_03625 [Planctomycetes bacterium]|nr:hypothetical protein [Planctomycetota bacterium]